MPLNGSQYSGENAPRVLMMDDQRIVCEAVRRMLLVYPEIRFRAVQRAECFFDEALAFAPTVILLDLDLATPELSGLDLIRKVRSSEYLLDVPIVVLSATESAETKREAFELGANDYIVKLPEAPEMLARIGYHSLGYTNLLARKKAQWLLNNELEEGSKYIRSIFPEPMNKNGVRARWVFEACTRLAGDAFGYSWNRGEYFLFGLHDVCGHGVAAALHSVSVLNVLRARALAGTDFFRPESVLYGLNEMFTMDRHGGKFFTLWYGAYHKATRLLHYACGGHPPALLLEPGQGPPFAAQRLSDGGMALGIDLAARFTTGVVPVKPGSRVYLFSDGVYEVPQGGIGRELGYEALEQHLINTPAEQCNPQTLADWVRSEQQIEHFNDDFSLIEVIFD